MEVKRLAKKWEIQNEKRKASRLDKEAKKLVLE